MTLESRARVKAFHQALKLAAGERATKSVPANWRNVLKSFPLGCCELASQMLVRYLKDQDDKLFPYVIAMKWTENEKYRGHVFVALDGEYIDLTLDQFPEYDNYIIAEPIESNGQLGTFLQKVRRLNGEIETREVPPIPQNEEKLYTWLRDVANELFVEDQDVQAMQQKNTMFKEELQEILSLEISPPQTYQDSDKREND